MCKVMIVMFDIVCAVYCASRAPPPWTATVGLVKFDLSSPGPQHVFWGLTLSRRSEGKKRGVIKEEGGSQLWVEIVQQRVNY